MVKVHFELLVNLNGPAPGDADSREGTAMYGDGLVALGDGCNISLTYWVENTIYT